MGDGSWINHHVVVSLTIFNHTPSPRSLGWPPVVDRISSGRTVALNASASTTHGAWISGSSLSSAAVVSRWVPSPGPITTASRTDADDPDLANEVIRGGHADLIAIGRAALATPDCHWSSCLGDA